MTGVDDALTLGERFRRHAAVCTSPLYAGLLAGMADDWDAGGPVREVVAGHEDAPAGSMVQLRVLAGLHRLVLLREAPQLATFYPSAGGHGSPEGAWPVAREVMATHVEQLRGSLATAPQTNEVGRSAPLVVGLLDAVHRSGLHRVRLLEVGASAGLNLLVDRYRVDGPDWSFGPPDAAVHLADAVRHDRGALLVDGVRPQVEVVQRRGCDLAPVDATTQDGRLLLTSYVWPDQVERFERLRLALAEAKAHPVTVDAAPAGEWLERVLAEPAGPGVLTVVWQSITRLYWPAGEVARVEAAVAAAGRRIPLAHVSMEYPDLGGEHPTLDVRVWRDGRPDGVRHELGTVGDHGLPVVLHPGVTLTTGSTS